MKTNYTDWLEQFNRTEEVALAAIEVIEHLGLEELRGVLRERISSYRHTVNILIASEIEAYRE